MTFFTPLSQGAACVDCPFYQSCQDGTDKGWCGLFNTFAQLSHQQTQDCINEINVGAALSQNQTPYRGSGRVADEQTAAQEELNEYVEVQAQTIAPEIEVDSDIDADFGIMYRVWLSYHLLGTFYRALDGLWVVQPVKSNITLRCATSLEAQAAIITFYDMPDEVVKAVAKTLI